LQNILIEVGILMKAKLTCLNRTCNEGRINKDLSDAFPIQNFLQKGDALSLHFNVSLEYAIRKFRIEIE